MENKTKQKLAYVAKFTVHQVLFIFTITLDFFFIFFFTFTSAYIVGKR